MLLSDDNDKQRPPGKRSLYDSFFWHIAKNRNLIPSPVNNCGYPNHGVGIVNPIINDKIFRVHFVNTFCVPRFFIHQRIA